MFRLLCRRGISNSIIPVVVCRIIAKIEVNQKCSLGNVHSEQWPTGSHLGKYDCYTESYC